MQFYVVSIDLQTDSSDEMKTSYNVFQLEKDAEKRYMQCRARSEGKSIKIKSGFADIVAVRLYQVSAENERQAESLVKEGSALKIRNSVEEDDEQSRFLDELISKSV